MEHTVLMLTDVATIITTTRRYARKFYFAGDIDFTVRPENFYLKSHSLGSILSLISSYCAVSSSTLACEVC